MDFTDNSHLFIAFSDNCEKGFFIRYLGFHNFNYIKPINYFRVQKFYTLHIVLSGSGTLIAGGKEYKVKERDMFFLPPDINFCYYPDRKNPWKYVWFELTGENASLYGEKMGFKNGCFLTECSEFDSIYLILQRIFTKQEFPGVGYYDVLSSFYKILDINIKKDTEKKIDTTEDIINYINCHYTKPTLSLLDICSYFNLSHSYICKIFKEKTGHSIKNHIIRVRIKEACKLLKTTELGIKEISCSVGYTDEIHFMKSFKEIMGKTPTNYRKESKNEL